MPRPPAGTPALYVVRRSRIHGNGVYARRSIREGSRIIEYVGERITKKESDRRYWDQYERYRKSRGKKGAVYIFELNKRHDIDGNVPYNQARLINHSCDPNTEVAIIRGHIWIVALRDIEPGEEITYNYGYDLEAWEDHPCRCGAGRCLGYIVAEEHRARLRRILRRRRNRTGSGNETNSA